MLTNAQVETLVWWACRMSLLVTVSHDSFDKYWLRIIGAHNRVHNTLLAADLTLPVRRNPFYAAYYYVCVELSKEQSDKAVEIRESGIQGM